MKRSNSTKDMLISMIHNIQEKHIDIKVKRKYFKGGRKTLANSSTTKKNSPQYNEFTKEEKY